MTKNPHTQSRILGHCDVLNEDDQVDPRQYFAIGNRGKRENHKTKRLCRQVAQTLDLVLSGECRNEKLQGLHVLSVDPAPDATQLSVTLLTDGPCTESEKTEILSLLSVLRGRLRSEVAAAISRKKTPNLLFRVISPPQCGTCEPPATDC